MTVPFFDLKRQYLTLKREIDPLIQQVIQQGWYVGGPLVTDFENDFAQYINSVHCVGCGSCTDALELILRGYGIGPGDEVIVPAFTWISDAEVVSLVGATIVFVDVLPGELTIDPESIKNVITKKTKAIIAVHLYGRPCRMNEIMQIALLYDLKVIEDCAQSAGALYYGKRTGSIGHASAFSFYPTKNLGAFGDGGAVTTDDPELASAIRLLTNHGQPERDVHLREGRTSRLDTLQAGILSLKLKYLDQWNERRRQIARRYLHGLKDIEFINLPVQDQEEMEQVYHLFVIQVSERGNFRQRLLDAGIQTAVHYPKALPEVEAYRYLQLDPGEFPVAEGAAKRVLSIPMFPEMREGEVEFIVEAMSAFKINR